MASSKKGDAHTLSALVALAVDSVLASSAKAKVGKTHKAAKGKPVIRWRFNVFFLVVTVWRHAQAHAQLIVVVLSLPQPAHQRSARAKCLEYKIETALASAQADKTCPMIATALLASDKEWCLKRIG